MPYPMQKHSLSLIVIFLQLPATVFPLYEVREEEVSGERLHFVKFETKFIETCIDFIQQNLYPSSEKYCTLKVTGDIIMCL